MLKNIERPQIGQWQEQLARDGYLYLEDLPEGIDHYALAQTFGRLLPQYDGRYLWSIKADPQFDNLYHSLNTKKLSPHTECYEFEGLPPRYLALWCVRPASCGGGLTTLFDALAFFRSLSPEVRRRAESVRFPFRSSSGIQKSNLARTAEHPFLDQLPDGRMCVRFSFNNVDFGADDVMRDAAQSLVDAFESSHVPIRWKRDAFLIWDNQRVLHSRTSYEDRERELRRVWLTDHDATDRDRVAPLKEERGQCSPAS
ncbi:MAG: TauD/TfdA family dioxygenase [Polyangiaceae bacterium]|jgi:alpha-ketoglutarate-dependent taurine dioxygenase|nr:TauD/TfdA family dioxygenase [Polyangiaceae bacterium]